MTDQGLIFGTPHYMSPEQGHGEPVDARSDLYSLGIILFEMLTGRSPSPPDNPMAILYLHRNGPLPRLPAGALTGSRCFTACWPSCRQTASLGAAEAADGRCLQARAAAG